MAEISYLHPHMQTSIVDNSVVVPEQTATGTVMFMPYFSSRGVDGEIKLYTSYSDFLLENGTPNFKKHGQAIYNILQFLSAGGSVYGIRLVPKDATQAFVDVRKGINAETGEIEDSEEDADQLIRFASLGRGEFGNTLRVQLDFNKNLTEGYRFAIYELLVLEAGRVIEGPYYVALNPEARDSSGQSMFIKNIVDRYSSRIKVEMDEDQYDALIEGLAGEDDPLMVDILGLEAPLELALEGGSDGSPVFGKGEEIIQRRTELLSEAFANPEIINKRRYPLEVLMDANFDSSVKTAIAGLANKRGDCFAFFDLTTEYGSDVESALNGMQLISASISERKFAVYGQNFVVYDAFTNSDINVTMTYLLAGKIPAHDTNYGVQFPFAGPNRGLLTGFKSMSFNPEPDEKEALYRARINYAEQDYRTTKLMSQLTAQSANTALSNINNMRTLLRMIVAVEEISENYFFEFASPGTLSSFESAVNNYLATWVANGACTVCNGSVYQNEYDISQKIVRVSVEVVFTGIIERIVIEFNVGANA